MDEERVALTELRRVHGRDVDAWPAKDRDRYRRWEAAQLERKDARDREHAAKVARALTESLPESPDEPKPRKRVRRG